MRAILVTSLLTVLAVPAAAQMISRPTDAPQVSAAGESWYRLREPIQYAGELYYPAGASVFFNGNSMVRTGHYNGVPLYADATRDPYSLVLVPIGGGQLQPYERRRRGDLAGSTGTTLPSFPIALRPDGPVVPMAAGAPTNLPLSTGAISTFTPEVTPPVVYLPAVATAAAPACSCEPTAVPATAVVPPLPTDRVAVLSARRPDNNDGVWIRFDNATWVSTGAAEPRTTAFTQVGEHAGFAVFRKQDGGDVIYLQSREGVLAPYRRKS
ncbi:MAG TPA: hypothetical protein VFO31_29740 [Vicinamibacterales bacterium]|nr:hypothetical protein [Vicinamibacterales bacterium]